MKILITSQVYYPERFSVNEVAEGLLRLGHEVEVITGKPNCGFDKKLDEYKNVIICPNNLLTASIIK